MRAKSRLAKAGKRRIRAEGAANASPDRDRQPDMTVWRLPSGKPLAEFALEAGFVVPGLLKTRGKNRVQHSEQLLARSQKGN